MSNRLFFFGILLYLTLMISKEIGDLLFSLGMALFLIFSFLLGFLVSAWILRNYQGKNEDFLGFLLFLPVFFLMFGFLGFLGGPWRFFEVFVAIVSLFAGLYALKRSRAFDDTPTSSISSAAQGYVRLCGIGRPLQGSELCSPMTGERCLWYRYVLEVRDSRGKWSHAKEEESNSFFLIDDGSGRCIVTTNGATVETRHKRSYAKGATQRVTEWLLRINDKINAVGEFSSQHGGIIAASADENVPQVTKHEERNPDTGLGELLGKWKSDPDNLKKRFDLNKDGVIDSDEWELARQAARRELAKQRETEGVSPTHSLNYSQVSRDDGRNPGIGLNELLRKWKADPANLKNRFDLNKDGIIDTDEWELARQAARQELEKRQREIEITPSIHTLSCPGNGQKFLITNTPPNRLSRKALWSARFCFAIFLGMLVLFGFSA